MRNPVLQRFKQNKLAMFGVYLMLAMFIFVLLAPVISSYQAVSKMHVDARFSFPGSLYIFGTDEFGRDLLARVVYGGRISLFCSLGVIAFGFVIGASIGAVAGYLGGKVDTLLMRCMDVLMSVPSTLLAMAIITALGNGIGELILALGISQIARFARIVRSSVLTVKSADYVEAAKCYGMHPFRIMLRHIIPNAIGPIIVSVTLALGQTILSISSMGYLGLGVSSPQPEWGTIISENKMNVGDYPYLGLIPGACIVLTVMAVNFIGDGLADAFNPKRRK